MAKVLLVEDDNNLREIYAARLEAEGYEMSTAADGEEALASAVKIVPDLIILDVLLSGGDGREICKKLKSNQETENIPVIIVSAHPSAGKSIEISGADDFLEKPFEMETLLKKVSSLLKNSKN